MYGWNQVIKTESFAIQQGMVETKGSTCHDKGLTNEMHPFANIAFLTHKKFNVLQVLDELVSFVEKTQLIITILNHHVLPERYGRNVNFFPNAALHAAQDIQCKVGHIWALKP